VLTLGNAACGVAALLAVSARGGADGPGEDVLRLWAGLLLLGTVLDVLDGAAARRWGGTALGGPLDGMADAITFGLAPPVALATFTLRGEPRSTALLVGAGVCAYATGALLRLADFAAHRSGDGRFTGLPSPLAAVGVLDLAFLTPPPLVAGAGLAVLGLLMASRLHYPANRGSALRLALAGWALGLAGLFGLVDVRIPAWSTLAVIAVVLPALTTVGRWSRVPAHLPTC
jgi:phosphatidylserine synthase